MTPISFEFYPPKTDEQRSQLDRTVGKLKPHAPEYVSCTFGAGGSTLSYTADTVQGLLQTRGRLVQYLGGRLLTQQGRQQGGRFGRRQGVFAHDGETLEPSFGGIRRLLRPCRLAQEQYGKGRDRDCAPSGRHRHPPESWRQPALQPDHKGKAAGTWERT